MHRRRLLDGVLLEIGLREDAAARLTGSDDRATERAAIERVGSVLGKYFERPGELGLDQPVACSIRLAVLEENRRDIRLLREGFRARSEYVDVRLAEDEAFCGETDRRRHDLRPAHRAIAAQRGIEAERRARHADGKIAARAAP